MEDFTLPQHRKLETTLRTIFHVDSEDLPEINNIQKEKQKCTRRRSNSIRNAEYGRECSRGSHETILKQISRELPETWRYAEIILIHKKGDNTNIENCKPISLLSHLYRLLTRIITNRENRKIRLVSTS